jgi:hypothetical protein
MAECLLPTIRKTTPRYFYEFIACETSPGLIVIPQSLSVAAEANKALPQTPDGAADEHVSAIEAMEPN